MTVDQRPNREVYSPRENPGFETWIATRKAAQEAAFFLPHLRPGMRVLDVGCGPGSITLGLAEVVAPGEVVGIDIDEAQVQRARDIAVERSITNVRFELGDGYRLLFPDRSFDAVFAHGVLCHLREPVRALEEMRRVLRPCGIAGVREPDFGTVIFSPTTPLIENWFALVTRVVRHSGGDLLVGRHLRRLLVEAGFVRPEAGSSTRNAGSLEETRRSAAFIKTWPVRTALTEGWVTQATVDATVAEIDAWAERPDAFYAGTWCEAVGRMRD